jgi:hypothetical protein
MWQPTNSWPFMIERIPDPALLTPHHQKEILVNDEDSLYYHPVRPERTDCRYGL